jgi:hypothetical protein
MIVASLRGGVRSTPVRRKAFDDEGMRRSGNLQHPPRRPGWVDGAGKISLPPASQAQALVMRDAGRRELVSHSFPFFTGLCEKSLLGAAFACGLSRTSQMIVVQKDWIDCACAL